MKHARARVAIVTDHQKYIIRSTNPKADPKEGARGYCARARREVRSVRVEKRAEDK
jgi:hypothetical protein